MYRRNRRWEFYVESEELESLRGDWQKARVHCHEFGRRNVQGMNPNDIITYVNKENIFDRYNVRAGEIFKGSPYTVAAMAAGTVAPERCVPRSVVVEFETQSTRIDSLVSRYFSEELPQPRKFDSAALVQHIHNSPLYKGGDVAIATLKSQSRAERAA